MIRTCALGMLFLIVMAVAAPAAYAAAQSSASKGPETQVGLASYYSRRFDGKETASGETFSNEDMVAAHRKLPMGTRVRVTNLENGESVVVRINDRGASAQNRKEGVIIDVSQAAATKLRMKKDGRVKVRVDVLEWGDDRK
jgi:rare lipoprotein A